MTLYQIVEELQVTKMEHINHITLNTGHIRKTYPHEVDKDLYFKLRQIYKKSLSPDGTELFDGFIVKTTQTEIGAITTIFKAGVPILTTACSKNDDGSLWKSMHEYSTVPLQTKPTDKIPLPYIADRVEIGAVFYPGATQWTGDFARCMGWMILAPEKIRQVY